MLDAVLLPDLSLFTVQSTYENGDNDFDFGLLVFLFIDYYGCA